MRDDFDLFDSPGDDGHAVDPDVALITAWLARELSPMQVLAVEERLTTDVAFRALAQPLIDSWAAPVASLGVPTGAALSESEKLESWRRFQSETLTGQTMAPRSTRRTSMKRVAAVIGVTVLPVVTFAQAVVYSASNENAPGHRIAERIVLILSPGAPRALVKDRATITLQPVDQPVARQLATPPQRPVQRAAEAVTVPVTTTIAPAKPDRAKIIELAKQHQPAVVRGDTVAHYIVMVLDASGAYQWSTYGSGNVLFEVAGDTRTMAERNRENNEYRAELFGSVAGARGGGRYSRQANVVAGGAARGGGGDSAWTRFRLDSAYRKSYDSARYIQFPLRDSTIKGRKVRRDSNVFYARDSRVDTTKDAVARGRGGAPAYGVSQKPGTYRNGFVSTDYPPAMNLAPGLQEPGNGQSGVQGLPATAVSSSETYLFGAGELAPGALRVVVVNLVAGTIWRR